MEKLHERLKFANDLETFSWEKDFTIQYLVEIKPTHTSPNGLLNIAAQLPDTFAKPLPFSFKKLKKLLDSYKPEMLTITNLVVQKTLFQHENYGLISLLSKCNSRIFYNALKTRSTLVVEIHGPPSALRKCCKEYNEKRS